MLAYDILTATVAAMMAGNEFAVAVFAHPQLSKLDDKAHARMASLLAASLGRAMPLWYGVALVLIIGSAVEHRPFTSGSGLLIVSAGLLWAATILFTVLMLVPINNRIARMDYEQPHADWLQDRLRWDRLHRLRVALLILAVLLLFAGLFGWSPDPAS